MSVGGHTGGVDISAVISGLSLLVSVSACIYARQSAVAAREATVAAKEATSTANRPILRASVEGGNERQPKKFSYFIENNGNGPAIVKRATYSTASDEFGSTLFSHFSYYGREVIYHDLETSSAIPKGGKVAIVVIDISAKEERDCSRAYKDIIALAVRIEYETLTGEKTTVTLRVTR